MCGIVGKLNWNSVKPVLGEEIRKMLAPLHHRGPDGDGVHIDRALGLGHCRLAIIDLETGDQPMTNEDETIWIVFNGEIYNFKQLRQELIQKGHAFRSKSDTEVIVHLYEEYGLDCVTHLDGMFAFAVWDARERRLVLARDRVGIKPLYYHVGKNALLFGSEIKALIVDPEVPRVVDLSGLRRFLSFFYMPGDGTLFKGIHKLDPGCYAVVHNGEVAVRRYWDLHFTDARWSVSYPNAVEELDAILCSAVTDHMIADVPVGVLLSGGVDSSAVCSMAVRNATKQIHTFTVGFGGGGVVDERSFARDVASLFHTEHHEITFDASDFVSFLPTYIWHMEEPVHEPPAIALHYVSKLARQYVKVVLSGEGGDEAFGGYPNYPGMLALEKAERILGFLARPAGSALGLAGRLLNDARIERYAYAMGRPLYSHYFSRRTSPTSYFNRRAMKLLTSDMLSETENERPGDIIRRLTANVCDQERLNQMLYIDTKTWLPDDLLVKADKITMANSLELRVPFLDHHVLEFAASLPPSFKVDGRETKRILKAVFAQRLPEKIIKRKKAGFPVPYETWFRGPVLDWSADILLSERAMQRGYFQRREVARLLNLQRKEGRRALEVFCLLLVELWHRKFIDKAE